VFFRAKDRGFNASSVILPVDSGLLPNSCLELADTLVGTVGVESFLDDMVAKGKILNGLG
jgi:hypothetical protein